MSVTFDNRKAAVIYFHDPNELGIESNEFIKRIIKYSSKMQAVNAYANTRCYWSEVIMYETDKELKSKAAQVEKNLMAGKYIDFI